MMMMMMMMMMMSSSSSQDTTTNNNKCVCVRELSQELHGLNNKTIPSTYAYFNSPDEFIASNPSQESIPTIDLSPLITSDHHPDQRSRVIQDLHHACQEWGFFMVVNHGISEGLMKEVVDACNEFFKMEEEEKEELKGKHVLDPIRYGTSFNASKEKVFFWRDFLKLIVHPLFHCPTKPHAFSELLLEYCTKMREVALNLLRGLSESLGLEEDCCIHKALDFDKGLQIFVANYYPPCPQPELAIGLPPHSDHGLLTLLIQNGVGGLQIQHNDKWVDVNPHPNSILVNVGDHLEIFSNGKYKSVLHRAVVNNDTPRISLALANGPSLDTIVSPASQLVVNQSLGPAYTPMKYKDYVELQQSGELKGKSCLNRVKTSEMD